MAENNNSQEQPFLLNGSSNSKHETVTKKSSPFPSLFFKLALKSLIWAIFSIWVCAIFFYCTGFASHLLRKWVDATEGTLFGITGSIFLGFSAPILIIAFLAFIYVSAFPRDEFEANKSKFPRFRLWTFPVLVDGPFGVVSASEFIGIALFIVYVLWSITYYIVDGSSLVSKLSIPSKEKSSLMMALIGVRLGSIGIFCTIFLFLPISRGSILLRLIDIPFEHATRYHVWLGHLTMFLFTLHGLFYVAAWGLQGNLLEKLVEWKEIGVANLPGVISLLAGLLMWVTSLLPVRKNRFELFFYTHQLYIIFVVFLVMHVGDFIFSIAAGAIFLFILDRFLRFCQSRTKVDLISASCRPCGTLELTFSKPANLSYNALSFIFVQVRELSFLQWHPFSVSSSPSDGKYHITVLVKVLGNWTEKLRELITNHNQNGNENENGNNSLKITACVEGPYGHESPYHLMYENLILVAGGIGISPFLAILSDILHRINEGKPCLPKNVMVIWAIKKSNELSLLSVIDSQSICPSFPQKLDLQIQTFITQQSDPSLEEGKIEQNNISFPSIFMKNGTSMSSLVGTGNNIFTGLYVILSTFGFITFFALVQLYYFDKFGIYQWWYRGLLFIGCMVGGVVVVGGIVVISWHLFERKSAKNENKFTDSFVEPVLSCEETGDTSLANVQTIRYGSRPNFEGLFTEFSDKVGNVNIGVIVCGPYGLQSSVAKECRSQNFNKTGRKNNAIFHFNSHSFDL